MIRTIIALRRSGRRAVGRASARLATLTLVIAAASAPHASAVTPMNVLQLNLCNSGSGDCHAGAGKSIESAIAVIKKNRPDVVTLNEVCATDITAMSQATGYRWAFEPATRSGGTSPARCASGRGDFGVALLSNPDVGAVGDGIFKQAYRNQDGVGEQRVILCAPYARFTACTTQLSRSNAGIAFRQCKELAGVVTRFGRPTVVGGDFNLTDDTNPNVRECVPPGWIRAGDGDVQHVMANQPSFGIKRSQTMPVDGTIHRGLLVELTW